MIAKKRMTEHLSATETFALRRAVKRPRSRWYGPAGMAAALLVAGVVGYELPRGAVEANKPQATVVEREPETFDAWEERQAVLFLRSQLKREPESVKQLTPDQAKTAETYFAVQKQSNDLKRAVEFYREKLAAAMGTAERGEAGRFDVLTVHVEPRDRAPYSYFIKRDVPGAPVEK